MPFDGSEPVVRCDNFCGPWGATSHTLQCDGRSFFSIFLQYRIVLPTSVAEKWHSLDVE